MTRGTGNRVAGYSMVELVAALTIFSICVGGLLELFSTCLRSTGASMDYANAVMLAESLMEETLAESYLVSGSDSGEFSQDFPAYSWELEIRDTESYGLMEVQVTVLWTERGREESFSLTTLKADRI